MDLENLKGLRDFVLTYNKIADDCFNLCVTSFASRDMNTEEETCIHNCTKRYINSQTRLSRNFAEIQFKKMNDALKNAETSEILTKK